jgi:hypothetical protein
MAGGWNWLWLAKIFDIKSDESSGSKQENFFGYIMQGKICTLCSHVCLFKSLLGQLQAPAIMTDI